MDDDHIRDALGRADGLTRDLPVEIRSVAFDVILTHLLRGRVPGDVADMGAPPDRGLPIADVEESATTPLPAAHVVKEGSRDQQAVWAVMALAARGEQVTTTSVSRIIRDELGCTPEDPNNLSTRLRALTPQYLSRAREGKSYVYSCTGFAQNVFREGQ